MKCRHCRRPIAQGDNGYYHRGTEAARCRDDASFTFAEPEPGPLENVMVAFIKGESE